MPGAWTTSIFNSLRPLFGFELINSNDCWQFDLSPSDLKQVPAPLWIEEGALELPTLMLFSVVDDPQRRLYQEYRCVYGEDAASGLRFLFNAAGTPRRKKGWSCRVFRR